MKLARKVHRKCRSKKKLERLYEVLAPESHILKIIPISFTIDEPVKSIVTVRKSDIATFGTQKERQTSLNVHADHRGPRNSKKTSRRTDAKSH